eukprot:COSAG01_NODE_26391_length_715_cov_1.834416_1_plen_165_part_01
MVLPRAKTCVFVGRALRAEGGAGAKKVIDAPGSAPRARVLNPLHLRSRKQLGPFTDETKPILLRESEPELEPEFETKVKREMTEVDPTTPAPRESNVLCDFKVEPVMEPTESHRNVHHAETVPARLTAGCEVVRGPVCEESLVGPTPGADDADLGEVRADAEKVI